MDLDPVPLAILLVKDGSRGDKLMFKYPYCTQEEEASDTTEVVAGEQLTKDEQQMKEVSSDSVGQRKDAFKHPNPYAYTDPDSDPFAAVERPSSNIDKNGHLTGFTDKALSNLLAVKADMCGCRFELQVNDVRFVGHPMLVDSSKKTSLQMFHLAFVLNAQLPQDVVSGYYSLCQRLAVALSAMDASGRYFSVHAAAMLAVHEEVTSRAMCDDPPLDPYGRITANNSLAKQLVSIYHKLCSTGECVVNLDDWFCCSFVIPHKVYANLPIGAYFNFRQMCAGRRRLQRYMSIMLLQDRDSFQSAQFPLVTPTIQRVMDVSSTTSTLYKIAADADIVYSHLVDIVGHFVHWGMMMVSYPLCNRNLYVMSSKAIEIIHRHDLYRVFFTRFPRSTVTLFEVLQLFRTPLSAGQVAEAAAPDHKYEGFFVVLWLVEHGLITQIHKYVYISVPVQWQRALVKGEPQRRQHRHAAHQDRGLPAERQQRRLRGGRGTVEESQGRPNVAASDIQNNTEVERAYLHSGNQYVLQNNLFCTDVQQRLNGSVDTVRSAALTHRKLERLTGSQGENVLNCTNSTKEPSNHLEARRGIRSPQQPLSNTDDSRPVDTPRRRAKKTVSWGKERRNLQVSTAEAPSGNVNELLPDGSSTLSLERLDAAIPPDNSEEIIQSRGKLTGSEREHKSIDSNKIEVNSIRNDIATGHDRRGSQRPRASRRVKGTTTRHKEGVNDGCSTKSATTTATAAAGGTGSANAAEGKSKEEEELMSLLQRSSLTRLERCAALSLYARYPHVINMDDMRTFVRVSPYFRGEHHLEEVMYSCNLGRARLMDLLDKFRLMLCVVEGPADNYPINVD